MLPPMVADPADLVVGKPHRAARHGGKRASQHGIVEEALDRRGRTEPHASAIYAPLLQLGNFRHVDQHRYLDVAGAPLARPRIGIGGAGDDPMPAAIALESRRRPPPASPASNIRRRSSITPTSTRSRLSLPCDGGVAGVANEGEEDAPRVSAAFLRQRRSRGRIAEALTRSARQVGVSVWRTRPSPHQERHRT